jgi:hypothetical protein
MVREDQTVKTLRFGAAFFIVAALAHAHVGSPDVYLEGKAGPYQLFVTVRPPLTIPGVAEIEVRSESPGIRAISAVPLAIAGAGSKLAPIADPLKASPQDPQFFTGSLWMMTSGSWQVRLTVDGAQGPGILAVPLPSFARASKSMTLGLGAVLSVLGLFLMVGMAAMIGAARREAKLEPGQEPTPADLRNGRKATLLGALIVLAVVIGGNYWWNSEANDYSQRIYKPLAMSAKLNGAELSLTMSEPGWMQAKTLQQAAFRVFIRKMDDLVPDHGHIMHLYAIRQPGLDAVYHLHPEQTESGAFVLTLPSMVAGHYKLYADIVHANGFPETMVTEIDIPALASRPLAGDDAYAVTEPWQNTSTSNAVFTLPDGYKMEWLASNKPLAAKQPMSFRFRLTQPDGTAPADMALYMGMPGHAAFVKTDGTVFAHIHPNGSVSMAALILASGGAPMNQADMQMPGMQMAEASPILPDTVSFPYGFPSPGRYRIFVQMKHGQTIETGVFDAVVAPA